MLPRKRDLPLLLMLFFLFLFTLDFQPVPIYNQHEYYVHAFARVNPDLFTNDMFVQTRLKHVVFSGLVEILYRLNIVELGSHVINVVLKLILYVSMFLISRYTVMSLDTDNKLSKGDYNSFGYIVSLILLLISESQSVSQLLIPLDNIFRTSLHSFWSTFQFWVFDGLAHQRIYEDHLLAADFGVLIFYAIAIAVYSRWRVAAILLAVSVNFHFSYSIHSGILIVLFVLWLIHKKERSLALQILLIFGMCVLPITLHSLTLLDDPGADFANEIFVYVFAGHALPSTFWGFGQAMKMTVIIFSAILCLRFKLNFLGIIIILAWISVIVGLFYVHFTSDYTIALMFPWRSTVYLVPLAYTLLFSLIGAFVFMKYPMIRSGLEKAILISFAIVIVIDGFLFLQSSFHRDSTPSDMELFFDEINQATEPTDVILVPAQGSVGSVVPTKSWGATRMLAQRALYVDSLAVPIMGKDVAEWWDRIKFVESFYEESLETQLELCHVADVDYFVRVDKEALSNVQPTVYVYPYYLYACH